MEYFVYKSNGEFGVKHPDIAFKLTALIYSEFGFARVYSFLTSFLNRFCTIKKTDYKTLIQEYVQRQKLPFEYRVIDTSGPDHEKRYTCQLAVGNRMANASAIGKKNAEKAVAEEFARQYHISANEKRSNLKGSTQIQLHLTDHRKRQLIECFSQFNIRASSLPVEMMNIVLTHKSYLYECQRRFNFADYRQLKNAGKRR